MFTTQKKLKCNKLLMDGYQIICTTLPHFIYEHKICGQMPNTQYFIYFFKTFSLLKMYEGMLKSSQSNSLL